MSIPESTVRLVILIPHDDTVAPIQAYQSRLFAAGLRGALSLPACVILGRTPHPLRKEELKTLASNLRGFNPTAPFVICEPLSIPVDQEPAGILGIPLLACPITPALSLGAAAAFEPLETPVMPLAAGPGAFSINSADSPFPLRFKAGCVANLVLRRLTAGVTGLSFEWERGAPVWMPKPKAASRRWSVRPAEL